MRLENDRSDVAAPVIEVEVVPATKLVPVIPCDACSTWCRPAVVLRVQGLLVAVCETCFGPGSADRVHDLLEDIRKKYVRAADVLSETAATELVKTAASAAALPQEVEDRPPIIHVVTALPELPCVACATCGQLCHPVAALRGAEISFMVCATCFGEGDPGRIRGLLCQARVASVRFAAALRNAERAELVWDSAPASSPSPNDSADHAVMH